MLDILSQPIILSGYTECHLPHDQIESAFLFLPLTRENMFSKRITFTMTHMRHYTRMVILRSLGFLALSDKKSTRLSFCGTEGHLSESQLFKQKTGNKVSLRPTQDSCFQSVFESF